jgi:acetoin utilization deacetylase AcuC-like enzyme
VLLSSTINAGNLAAALGILKNSDLFLKSVLATHTPSYVALIIIATTFINLAPDNKIDDYYLCDSDCRINKDFILAFFGTLYAAYTVSINDEISSITQLEGGYVEEALTDVTPILVKNGDEKSDFLATLPGHHFSPGKPQGFCLMSTTAIMLFQRL